MFTRPKDHIPTKFPSKKSDLAPIVFFIDVLESESFGNPILPIPVRVDRISNGLGTLLVFPRKFPTISINGLSFGFNPETVVSSLIENSYQYSNQKHKEIILTPSNPKKVLSWSSSTQDFSKSEIRTFSEDMEFLLQLYLEQFKKFKSGVDGYEEKELLIGYCKKGIKYLQSRVESNEIEIIEKKK